MSKTVMVETSARHVHVTDADLAILFGEGHKLTPKKDLSQPGQYACEEKVRIVGPKGELKASILGPTRPESQVELSLTDARSIGVVALVRESGNIAGTNGVKLIGPAGEVDLKEGVIAAKRHIHFDPKSAEEFGVTNGQIVSLKVTSDERSLVFGDVVCRVSEKYALAAHIDTDESNAANCGKNVTGTIIK